jgi:hypothetical protein
MLGTQKMKTVNRSFPVRRFVRLIATASIAATALACSDHDVPTSASPLQANVAASFAKASSELPGSFLAQGLLRDKPLAAPVTVTKVIMRGGGTISISEADFLLRIPANAFSDASMTFTVTALAGSTVAYEFGPHGAVFLKPLQFIQQLGHTNLKNYKPAPSTTLNATGAYFPNANLVDPITGLAVVSEMIPTSFEFSGNSLTFDVWHFSGYMIATGRQ